jgi:hypothetical protein
LVLGEHSTGQGSKVVCSMNPVGSMVVCNSLKAPGWAVVWVEEKVVVLVLGLAKVCLQKQHNMDLDNKDPVACKDRNRDPVPVCMDHAKAGKNHPLVCVALCPFGGREQHL